MIFKNNSKLKITEEELKMLEDDLKREPQFKEIKEQNFIVKKDYIQLYDEIIVKDPVYQYEYKKIINREKILIPLDVQKNKKKFINGHGYDFYTYEFPIRKDGIHLNGFIYKKGKWKKTISSRLKSPNVQDGLSGLATVSAILVGVIILGPIEVILTPFKKLKKILKKK